MRFPTMYDVKNSRFSKWVIDICNTNIGAKIIVSLLIWGIALIPFYLYLLIRWGIGPEGFWQELALIIAACIGIGWLQGFLLFFAIFLTIAVITEDF